MRQSAGAWLLSVSENQKIAVAEYQMYEYVVSAQAVGVPLAPSYCQKMLFWQDRLVPMITLNLLLDCKVQCDFKGYVIVAYQSAPKAPIQYVGLSVTEPPVRITVEDKFATTPPEELTENLHNALVSCFLFDKQPVPILNIAHICSKEFQMETLKF